MYLSKRPMGVVLCFLALTAAACSTSGKGEETSGGPGTTDPTSTTVDEDGSTTTETKGSTTTTAPATGGTIEVTESGFSFYKDSGDASMATAGAVIENTGETPAVFFNVVFTFLDADDKPVATESIYVEHVAPGATGYAVIDYVELNGKAESLEVDAFTDEELYHEGASLEVEVSSVGPLKYGDGSEIKGTATNDTDKTMESYTVACVLRVEKDIVGGTKGYLDNILPGKSIAWDTRGSVNADTADCVAGSSY